ncbi:ABC transporter ATP-binding protein [Tsukamurella ocularis]|uniref:ABC transporter ATP-binding protein n=1 Tax=Tsukamurella ocularis TaxID=1970234 RepID=UPI00216A042C|nr:ABC transporter ATP-binding protein [Tsukamurella ocularis]MCS3778740.1 ATP-binding cassette subfamily C protein [Tsukamurella ocularis]MCS3789441.1 ATP-binding cassette subfamily C protein [Tsukamurella ocularis]MCS3851423.1 ATP-binding cassette subfamily C protein [Tsukamurella ocularis]
MSAPTTTVAAGVLPIADGAATFRFARGLLAGKRGALALVFVVLLVGAALGLAVPWGFGAIVDIAIDGGGYAGVLRIGGLMAAAAIASAVFTGLGIALSAQVFETALARLRESMVGAALRLSQSRVEEAGSGDLVSRATDDVGAVSQAISRGVPALARSGFSVAVTIAGFAALDWRFLAVVVVVLPVYVLGARMYVRVAPPVYRSERAAMAERAHHMLGSIRGLPTVHAYDLMDRASLRVSDGSWRVVRWTMRARIVQNRLFGRVNLAEFVGMAAILVLGFALVDGDLVTVGAVTTAMLLFLRLFGPIGALLLVMDDIQSAGASLARIVGVIGVADDEASGPAPSGVVDVSGGPPRVEVDGVTFGYGGGRRVLDGVTVRLEPGETVAVVGTSGAGKTTLAALIAGVHVPDAGTVRIGGADLATLSDSAAPVLLTQDVHVFAGTLAEDLRMAAPSASDEHLHAALARVGADEWVSLLDAGLDTVVGAGGQALTPQREQQLALARLVLLDPPVVILDEATADADSADADLLEEAAQAALVGRTALVVAHRLSQAARADRILVMERGAIAEQGTHDELRSAGGRYAALWAAWSRHR